MAIVGVGLLAAASARAAEPRSAGRAGPAARRVALETDNASPEPSAETAATRPEEPTGLARPGGAFRVWKYDLLDFGPDLWTDARRLLNLRDAAILAAAAGASLAVRETLDDDVADNVSRHRKRWGHVDDWTNVIGHPGTHFAGSAALYLYAIQTRDPEIYAFSKTLTRVLVINGLSVLALKLAADTEAPNGTDYAWPSGHTASSVAIATLLDQYYGHPVGVPAYAVAGLVAWGRIDVGGHDLSDCVFGAALGYVVARTIGQGRRAEVLGLEISPWLDPDTGASGLALHKRF